MENNRASFGSNFGFLMAAVGSAVGSAVTTGAAVASDVLSCAPHALIVTSASASINASMVFFIYSIPSILCVADLSDILSRKITSLYR